MSTFKIQSIEVVGDLIMNKTGPKPLFDIRALVFGFDLRRSPGAAVSIQSEES